MKKEQEINDIQISPTKSKYVRKLCPHNRRKYQCADCGGTPQKVIKCPHGRRKIYCIDCGNTPWSPPKCDHGQIKYNCVMCGGVTRAQLHTRHINMRD